MHGAYQRGWAVRRVRGRGLQPPKTVSETAVLPPARRFKHAGSFSVAGY